jgi:hypothetical protein
MDSTYRVGQHERLLTAASDDHNEPSQPKRDIDEPTNMTI